MGKRDRLLSEGLKLVAGGGRAIFTDRRPFFGTGPVRTGGFGLTLTISRRTMALWLVVIVAVSAVAGYVALINGGSLNLSDTEARVVVSGSMDGEPRDYDIRTIPTGSLVLIHPVDDYSSLKVGDVLTFDYIHPTSFESMVVTHRIVGIDVDDEIYTYMLTGDSIADDPTNGSIQVVTSDSGDIHGKVVGTSLLLGQLVVFLSSWTGKLCLVVIPCLILVFSEMANIVRILRSGGEEDVPAETVSGGTEEVTFIETVEVREVPDDGLFRRSIR